MLNRYVKDLVPPRQAGQGLVEYALILVLVAVAVILVLSQMGTAIQGAFTKVVSSLNT